MKRVLLTGGLGFIGAHTVEHYLKNTDWQLVVLDALRFSGRTERLTTIEGYDPSRVEVHWHDLRTEINPFLYDRLGDIDYIVNMASDSHVDRSIDYPVPFVHNNVMLALNMLEYARQVKPEKFIQVSTDEVYGPAPVGYHHAETDRLFPSNPYSASKASQEAIAFSYWRTYGVPVVVTNTMNNFGERQHPEKYVPMVVKRILNGEMINIHAKPTDQVEHGVRRWIPGSRVWLHARNHADAIQFILENIEVPEYGHQGPHEHPRFNVAGDREYDNAEIVSMITQIVGKPAVTQFVDFHSSRPGHDLRYSLDGSKLRNAGWEMPISTLESFERTVEWYLKHPEWLDDR